MLALGCTTTLKASTTQPNPLVAFPNQAMHRSEPLFIEVKDMDLPRLAPPAGVGVYTNPAQSDAFHLRQSAYFAIVSRDRLRFHVTVVHKWKEVADPASWNVTLYDEKGHVYYPEANETRYNDHVTQMWDREIRTAMYGQFGDPEHGGDVVGLRNDGYKRRETLDSVDVFQGSGDFSFHGKNLFSRDTHRLTLRMEKMGIVYEFTWNLVDLLGDEDMASANQPQ